MVLCASAGGAPSAGAWRGNFIAGAQGLMMSPCRSGERLAVEDRTPERDLQAVYRELAQRPGRAIFVELAGRREGRTLLAQRLVRAAAEGPGCREDLAAVRLRAQGTDPVWQLDARADGAWLRTRGGQSAAKYPAGPFSRSDLRYSYEGARQSSVLRVTVREERCRDPMLGALFTLRATAELDGRKFSGCAYWGDLGPGE